MSLSDYGLDPEYVRAIIRAQGLATKRLSPSQIENRIIAAFPALGQAQAIDASNRGQQLKRLAEEMAAVSFAGPVSGLRLAGGLTFPLTLQVAVQFTNAFGTAPSRGQPAVRNVRVDIEGSDTFADVLDKLSTAMEFTGDIDETLAIVDLIQNARIA